MVHASLGVAFVPLLFFYYLVIGAKMCFIAMIPWAYVAPKRGAYTCLILAARILPDRLWQVFRATSHILT